MQGLQVSAIRFTVSPWLRPFTPSRTASLFLAEPEHLEIACTRSEEHLPVSQESLDAMLKENTRLRSDAEFQQRKLDWLSEKLQQAEHNENQARRAAKEVPSWRPACI